MPVTILLTDTNWWPSSAHVAISLEGAGVRVAAAYPSHGHPLAKTEAVSARFTYSAISPLNSLAKAIRDSGADWVLPCDDRAVSHLHRLHSRATADGSAGKPLADLIERSLGSPDAFSIVSSRAALLRAALAEDIPVPEMSEVVSLEQLRLLAESKSFPWVMKVDGSWGGLGVKVVCGLKEAEDCFQRMRAPWRRSPCSSVSSSIAIRSGLSHGGAARVAESRSSPISKAGRRIVWCSAVKAKCWRELPLRW